MYKERGESIIEALVSIQDGDGQEPVVLDRVIWAQNPTSAIKSARRENGLKKSDVNDAVVLSRIPDRLFKGLGEGVVEVRARLQPLIERYNKLVARIKVLKI
ncbi:hypothetical protein HRbin02_01647 [Candidatus Calditenuaceae archaeon HR02]|nr:hypothetical protein HRbin02_01647 [Candidatus Calditenuaceae archaeon HR02]